MVKGREGKIDGHHLGNGPLSGERGASRSCPGHRAPLEQLSALERQQLKDVFEAIRQMQEATALRHATERLA